MGNCSAVPVLSRNDCGFDGITNAQCTAKGCCFDVQPYVSGPQCYHAAHVPSAEPGVGTPQVLKACDSTSSPPVQWTTTTTSTDSGGHTVSPMTEIAFAEEGKSKWCLSCAGPGTPCHLWGCTNTTGTQIDRNSLFSLVEQPSGGTYQIRSYTNTTLVPVGPGQAGPGYCLTAAVRESGSAIALAKCDPALHEMQVFQLAAAVVATGGSIQLPGDNRAQPPLPALCIDLGSSHPGPPGPSPPSPQPVPGDGGSFKARGPVHWGTNGCLSAAPTPSCSAYWGVDGYRQKECALIDLQGMLAAHAALKPSFKLAVSG